MSSTPFTQLYVGDYLADTMLLTTEQHGAYLLLLMTMWRKGASLPNDPKKLAQIAHVTPRKWTVIWEGISEFFTVEGDRITNARLTKEHQKATEKSRVRGEAGAKGGRAKALGTKEQALANATVLPKHSQKSEPEEKEDTFVSSKKIPRPKPKRVVSLPEDWVPAEMNLADAYKRGFSDKEINHEAERFRDHHLARGTAFKDWDAAWRTWLSNARKFAGNRDVSRRTQASGSGHDGSLASILAQRRLGGED